MHWVCLVGIEWLASCSPKPNSFFAFFGGQRFPPKRHTAYAGPGTNNRALVPLEYVGMSLAGNAKRLTSEYPYSFQWPNPIQQQRGLLHVPYHTGVCCGTLKMAVFLSFPVEPSQARVPYSLQGNTIAPVIDIEPRGSLTLKPRLTPIPALAKTCA